MHGHHHSHEDHDHDHSHPFGHHHGPEPENSRAFLYAFVLNFGFALVEFVGGYFFQSLAILSDSLHDLGDSGFLALAWIFQKIANKPRTQTFTFGYKRLSLSAALVNSFVLFVGSLAILFFAVGKLQSPASPNGWGMFGLSILGVIVNGAALLKLKGASGLNAKTAFLHLLEDVLGWVAVLIGSIAVITLGWGWVDPFLSILISLWVGFQSFRNLRKILLLHLQSSPEGIDTKALQDRILKLKGVQSVHDLHLWSMDGDYHVLTLHVGMKGTSILEAQKLKEKIRTISQEFHIPHATVEVEPAGAACPYQEC
ncbi:cation transporter [Leptospira langatensis]|uniref:Cation transporter n=1 Tax=Leptospira langatensis TaxID=2484983 RepID=A0A5F1ZWA5_9LEPT|nr:cation diffusion facilitator family transporter [Leptospira langatensis]TGK01422.1 cation transporter [Leptospira langatensis]TGL42128.1 cation transporter [Leptospira langatensis]